MKGFVFLDTLKIEISDFSNITWEMIKSWPEVTRQSEEERKDPGLKAILNFPPRLYQQLTAEYRWQINFISVAVLINLWQLPGALC